MSWEWFEHEVPCPCGKGKILVKDGSDDWGRSEHSEHMLCPSCRGRFVYALLRNRPDRPSGWMPRAEHERRAEEQAAGERRREEATADARKLHGEALIAALSHLRSRKEVWKALRGACCTTSRMWTFAEFNRVCRTGGRDSAISEAIDEKNVENVVKLIARLRS